MAELIDPNEHAIFERVARIVEAARARGERSVYAATIHPHQLIGREILEVELNGKESVGYGRQVIRRPAERHTERFGTQLEGGRRLNYAEDSQWGNGQLRLPRSPRAISRERSRR